MENINFEVGAKAARLIGRENIADVDGALIELIKNAYDADASCVCVWFDMPFPYVPTDMPAQKIQHILNEEDRKQILEYYDETEKNNCSYSHSCRNAFDGWWRICCFFFNST